MGHHLQQPLSVNHYMNTNVEGDVQLKLQNETTRQMDQIISKQVHANSSKF